MKSQRTMTIRQRDALEPFGATLQHRQRSLAMMGAFQTRGTGGGGERTLSVQMPRVYPAAQHGRKKPYMSNDWKGSRRTSSATSHMQPLTCCRVLTYGVPRNSNAKPFPSPTPALLSLELLKRKAHEQPEVQDPSASTGPAPTQTSPTAVFEGDHSLPSTGARGDPHPQRGAGSLPTSAQG